MISLVAFGADSNPAGASSFVGISVPVGIVNGDVIIVGITIPAAGVTITPPDASWTEIAQSVLNVGGDTPQTLEVIAFWKPAINEPVQWVFASSASCALVGACAVYRNLDSFTPIEAYAATITPAAGTHNIAGLTAALPGEELVLLLAAEASGTYTPATGFSEVVQKQQAGAATLDIQHKSIQNPGVIAAFTEAFSTSASGASILIVLAPSQGTLTYGDAYNRVFDGLPPGIDNVLDFSPNEGDFWNFCWVLGATLKVFAFDLIDILRTEIVPHLSRYKLPDWERIFELQASRIARLGTIGQRQGQILSAWRAAASQGSSIPTVQAILGPLLGYNASTIPQVIECSRSALTTAHTYTNAANLTLSASPQTSLVPITADGSNIGQMGVRLLLTMTAAVDVSTVSLSLTSPGGKVVSFASIPGASGIVSGVQFYLYAPTFAGVGLFGTWLLTIQDSVNAAVLNSWSIFTEAIGPGIETGGAIFDWGVYADPAHMGENGNAADINAARVAISKLAQSHSIGRLIQSLVAYPDVSSGATGAIPDECLPS